MARLFAQKRKEHRGQKARRETAVPGSRPPARMGKRKKRLALRLSVSAVYAAYDAYPSDSLCRQCPGLRSSPQHFIIAIMLPAKNLNVLSY